MSPLKATVQAIESDVATLLLEDGQTLRIPVSSMEGTGSVGASVFLVAVLPGGENAGQSAVAKHVLNELLGGK